ncbi:CHY zinc finger protein [Alkalicoccobacillus gibsonii]|uniref:CHY zinc finger protein n=1 Tax=Alkalicoccobacillus gibsonii TaxID=79881 RepID=UPI0035114B7C
MCKVRGPIVDEQTRCIHYHSETDIIAIKFKCCGHYYPCYQCHNECEDHQIEVWPEVEFHRKAILCGVCKTELTIEQYKNCDHTCPFCSSFFNEGCLLHSHIYFQK